MAQSQNELWQGYGDDGEPQLAKGLSPKQCASGALHGAAHLWIWRIWNGTVQLLLQKRADSSKTWPGFIDASAGGHIDFGEKPIDAVLREAKEEISIEIKPDKVDLLFVHRQELEYEPANIIENEIQWVYGYDLTGKPHLDVDKREVKSVAWVSLDRFKQLVVSDARGAKIVPHDRAYIAELLYEVTQLSDPR